MERSLKELQNRYRVSAQAARALYWAVLEEETNEFCGHCFDETERYRGLHREETRLRDLSNELVGGAQALNEAINVAVYEPKRRADLLDRYNWWKSLSA